VSALTDLSNNHDCYNLYSPTRNSGILINSKKFQRWELRSFTLNGLIQKKEMVGDTKNIEET